MYGTPQQVKDLTGVTPKALNVSDDAQLDGILTTWLEHISAEIDARIRGPIDSTDPRYKGIEAVALRTVSKLVGYAIQNRSSHVVQVGDFANQIVNASEVIQSLNEELKPYIRGQVTLFLSSEEWVEDVTTSY